MPSVQYTPSIHGPYGAKKMLRKNRAATDQAGIAFKSNSMTAHRLAESSAPGTRRSTRLRANDRLSRPAEYRMTKPDRTKKMSTPTAPNHASQVSDGKAGIPFVMLLAVASWATAQDQNAK